MLDGHLQETFQFQLNIFPWCILVPINISPFRQILTPYREVAQIHIKSYSYFFIILFHDSFKIKFIWTICLANLSRRQADDRPRNLSTYTFYKLKEWYIIIRSWGLVYHYFQIISRIKILCFSSFYFKKFLLNELCTTQRLFMER